MLLNTLRGCLRPMTNGRRRTEGRVPAPRRAPSMQMEALENRTTPDCSGFLTVTQGGWGAVANGHNPATYRDAHFASVFPSGLQIGDLTPGAATADNTSGHWAALFTSSLAVQNYLPDGSTASTLGGDFVDPTHLNVLAGQTVALTLTVGFDAADPNFDGDPSNPTLGSLIYTASDDTSVFNGMTVQAILNAANQVLSGATVVIGTTTITPDLLNKALTAINEEFDGGVENTGNNVDLECSPIGPPPPTLTTVFVELHKFEDHNADGIRNGTDSDIAWEFTVDVGPYSFTVTTGTPATFDNNADGDTLDVGEASFDGNVLTVTVDDADLAADINWSATEADVDGWTHTTATSASGTFTTDAPSTGSLQFGNFQNVSICGTKFEDRKGDDTPATIGTADDVALSADQQAVTIHLLQLDTDSSSPTFGQYVDTGLSQVTDASGEYCFKNIGPGTYMVKEDVPGGWTETAEVGATTAVGGDAVGGDAADAVLSGGTSEGNDFANFQNVLICGHKFYDANANGRDDDGKAVAGIEIVLVVPSGPFAGTYYTTTNANGDYCFGDLDNADGDNDPRTGSDLGPGMTVSVYEVLPSGTWIQTAGGTASDPYSIEIGGGGLQSGAHATGYDFGDVCLGAGGGLTLGFWSNKNGQKLFGSDDLALMDSLNLRNANGSNFDPTSYTQFRTWLLNASATNMANMLSAQLAAMELNVLNGFVSGSAVVYAGPSLGFMTINDLMTAANAELGLHGLTPSGSPYRAYQEALKNALDAANNNLNFVHQDVCPVIYLAPEPGTRVATLPV